MLSINNNIAALSAYRHFNTAAASLEKSSERLASGSRINWASDDAAGLTISEGLRSQISGSKIASRNAQDAMSIARTAEGGVKNVQTIVGRLRDLALEASSDTLKADARAGLVTEAALLVEELEGISKNTSFNGMNLLDGSAGTAGVLTFQVGANAGADNQITLDLSKANVSTIATALGSLDFSTSAAAQTSLGTIDTESAKVSEARATLGASYNRFERVTKTLAVAVENLTAADSRIRDTDMAAEAANLTRHQIQTEYAAAMLAQANQQPSRVLSMLL